MQIQWHDLMTTGVDEVDRQHKGLIDKLNELGDAIISNKGQIEIDKILDFVQVYTVQHFSFEEKCFEQYECPEAIQNKLDHEKFVQRFLQLRQEYEGKGNDHLLILEIHSELTGWLVNHIWRVDTKLKNWVVPPK